MADIEVHPFMGEPREAVAAWVKRSDERIDRASCTEDRIAAIAHRDAGEALLRAVISLQAHHTSSEGKSLEIILRIFSTLIVTVLTTAVQAAPPERLAELAMPELTKLVAEVAQAAGAARTRFIRELDGGASR